MSKFGRVPPATVDLFQKTVQQVREQVLPALPGYANDTVKAYTVERCLETVFADWRENENSSGLDGKDVEDFRSFVAMAASLAGGGINDTGLPIYQASLKGLLEDWLANWNAPGDPGPPGPID